MSGRWSLVRVGVRIFTDVFAGLLVSFQHEVVATQTLMFVHCVITDVTTILRTEPPLLARMRV